MSDTKIAVTVTQGELESIAQHRREMTWHKAQLDKMEEDVLHLMLSGADVEPGRFSAKVAFRCMRAVSWKGIVVSELGKEFAEEKYRAGRLIRIPSLKLVEHPPLPLWDRKAG